MNVVMAHGFLDTGRLFRSLSRRLESEGHVCHAPTLRPRDGRLGIPDLARKLASFLRERCDPAAPLALVGFSMGALVARYYLQSLGGAGTTRAFFSIAAPFQGTLNAYLYPGDGTRQMRPGSAFLRSLNANSAGLGGLRVFTYRTPLDLMVPGRGSRIPGARDLAVWCPLHTLLVSDPQVINDIADRLAQFGVGSAGSVAPRMPSGPVVL